MKSKDLENIILNMFEDVIEEFNFKLTCIQKEHEANLSERNLGQMEKYYIVLQKEKIDDSL